MVIDLHTHSNRSDGTDTPKQLVQAASKAGVSTIALCDHDTMDGVEQAQEAGLELGVQVLRGLEMSTCVSGYTVHLLGYGARPDDAGLARALSQVRADRATRLPRIIEALNQAGVSLTGEDVLAVSAPGATIGRPHVADALVAVGVVANRQEAFSQWLNQGRPGYVNHQRIDLAAGINLIRRAGGVAVLAHAWGRGARQVLSEPVIGQLAKQGLDGLEVDHNDHNQADRAALAMVAKANELIATGSSDYHGLGKIDHDIGCNSTTLPAFEAILGLIGARGGCP